MCYLKHLNLHTLRYDALILHKNEFGQTAKNDSKSISIVYVSKI